MKKYKINVEINLTHKQLQVLSEMQGNGRNNINDYVDVINDAKDKIISSNPLVGMGLGADINMLVNNGFKVECATNELVKTKLRTKDFIFGLFQIRDVVIKSVDFELIKIR